MFRNGVIIFAADYLIVIIILLAVVFWLRQRTAVKKEIVRRAVISFPLIFIVSRIMGAFYYNPRPFVALNITPFVAHIADNGFPSDHTLLGVAGAALIFTFNKKWGVVLYTLAVLVGIGRVAALVHHPVDIVGSLIAASGVMAAVYYTERFFRRRHLQTPGKTV
ncbi:MAG: phosphatase PAP2 family protein [Candidatus Magasanikbacteria bacterium]|nr:phosphatase PAP2 family protein [Candidatus Magasanikbacteria bacterium]